VNIDKVNAALSKALVRIQEGEAQALRELVLSEAETEDDATVFESVIGDLADKLVAECQVEDEKAVEAIVEVAGQLAESGELPEIFGLDNPTDQDVDAWLQAVEKSDLVQATIQHLAS
jgi:hypothetical protein